MAPSKAASSLYRIFRRHLLMVNKDDGNLECLCAGFEELEKNVEYEERENEFDLDELHEDQRQQQEETDFVDLFANGPVPETSLPSMGVPTDLNRSFSTLAADVRRPTTSCSPDMYRDDDDQVAFLIPPLLEDYELGNGKGD